MAFAPFRETLQGIAVESTYNWYWLVDGLMDAGYVVHLAHVPALPQYSGLKYVDDHEAAMDGYEGGRTFGNFEKRLPQTDGKGQRIKYREWDVNPLKPGVNRGAERLVTGSDGSAHYTSDHYDSFKKIR